MLYRDGRLRRLSWKAVDHIEPAEAFVSRELADGDSGLEFRARGPGRTDLP